MIRSVDWPVVLRDLASSGISGYRVAQILDIEQSTVQRWADGSEPRHSAGMAILQIHSQYCGSDTTQLRITEAKPKV